MSDPVIRNSKGGMPLDRWDGDHFVHATGREVEDWSTCKEGDKYPVWRAEYEDDPTVGLPTTPLDLEKRLEGHAHFLARDCEGWEDMRADFHGLDMSGIQLSDVDLSGANFRETNLEGATFKNVNLTHAAMDRAHMPEVRMIHVDCSCATLKGANLPEAYLRNSKFCGADFEGADMSDTVLYYSDFKEANMREATLMWAKPFYSSFADADIKDITLSPNIEDAHVFDTENVRVFISNGFTSGEEDIAFYSPEDHEVKPCTAVLDIGDDENGFLTLNASQDAFHGKTIHDIADSISQKDEIYFPEADIMSMNELCKDTITIKFSYEDTSAMKKLENAVMALEKAIDPPTRMDRVQDLQGMRKALNDAVKEHTEMLDRRPHFVMADDYDLSAFYHGR